MFIPFIEVYCKRSNLDCKALLLLNNAPGHSQELNNIDPRITVMFIPPNTSSLLPPLDQGIISTFKAYYLKKTMKHLVSATSTNEDSVLSFWKNFNIKSAVEFIHQSWIEVLSATINGSWKKLWPECVRASIKNICLEEECIQETIEISHLVGFEEIAIYDITELLARHNGKLKNDELLQIETLSYAKELNNTAAMELTDKDANTLID